MTFKLFWVVLNMRTCSSHCAVTGGGNTIAGFASVPAKSCLPESLLLWPTSTNSLQNITRENASTVKIYSGSIQALGLSN